MNLGTISWLVTVPAGDINFKEHLKTATEEEIKFAIGKVKDKTGVKTKISALESELRKRGKNNG